MAGPTIEEAKSAINALYNNSSGSDKESASRWLDQLQNSVYGWEIADRLLAMNISMEASYFAAHTLRYKILHQFLELQPQQYQSLKESLLNHIETHHHISHAIQTQLSLALADLAVQMPQWHQVVPDLCQRFGNKDQMALALLEILIVLPEEAESYHLRVGANRRSQFLNDLRNCSHTVLQFLAHCLEKYPNDVTTTVKIFKCLGSWFNLGAFPSHELATSQLLTTMFHLLRDSATDDTLYEAVSDCAVNALYCAENLEKYHMLAEKLFTEVLSLPPCYAAAITSEDFDRCLNLCRIFTELGESFMNVLVSSPGQGLGSLTILDVLVTCVQHHQYEVAEVTFNFWYRLSEYLYKEEHVEKYPLFKPYIQRLLSALCVHCKVDPDHEGVLDKDSDFAEFRSRVADLIKDVIFIVGSNEFYKLMYQNLAQQQHSMSWESTEAVLFVMATVAPNIRIEDKDPTSAVLQYIMNLPAETHVLLRFTSVQLVGELAPWLFYNTDYLDMALQFLFHSVQIPKVSVAAALALENICCQCLEKVAPHFQLLLEVIKAIDNLHLPKDSANKLLEGAAKVLSTMPQQKITEGVHQLCALQVMPLNQILQSENHTHADPTIWLDRLATIFRHISPDTKQMSPHPCQSVIEEVWPVLSRTCTTFQADVRVIERCCRCIRFAIRCLGKNSVKLLPELVDQMILVYNNHNHSCFLYLASILVDEYGDEEGCIQGLVQMTEALSLHAFQILSQENGLVNNPDTVDDIFRLCARCLQHFPAQFLQSSVAEPVIHCAIAASTLQHRDANSSVMRFLRDMILSGQEYLEKAKENYQVRNTLVKGVLAKYGKQISVGLIKDCAGAVPTYMIPDVAEVMWEMLRFCKQETLQWISEALNSLPRQSQTGVITLTDKQLTDFVDALRMANSVKQIYRATREFARLFH